MLGLYLHIPFCQALCSYCNFNRGLYDAPLKARYVEALVLEIRRAAGGEPADAVFFGGGTPSLLEPDDVHRLIGACRESFALTGDAEVTLETNPETVTPGRIAGFLEAGVNRVSFGVQSFDDDELRRLERVHSAARAVEAVQMARAEGCRNLSLDLMLWLPGQTRASWRRTVERAVDLGADHLSMYLLELYPNAPLKEAMARAVEAGRVGPVPAGAGARTSSWEQTSDDEAADMYLEGLDITDAAGFEQYEISNVARPGRPSRHNLKYWQSGSWRGFGAGAHSTVGERRWRNVSAAAEYVHRVNRGESAIIERAPLSPSSRIQEALFTGLRLNEGIDRPTFLERFGRDPWTEHGETLGGYVEDGLMWARAGRFGLTRRGMLVANAILSEFV